MQYPMSKNLHLDDEYDVGCFGCGKIISVSKKEFEENKFNYCRKCIMRNKDIMKNKYGIPLQYQTAYKLAIDRELAKNPPL
jgi:peptide subunit release factor 1 (eRF1)